MKSFLVFCVRWSGVLALLCLPWFFLGAMDSQRKSPSLLPIYFFCVFYALWLAKVAGHVWARAKTWRYGWLARGYILLCSVPMFPITILGLLIWHKIIKFDYAEHVSSLSDAGEAA